MKDVLRALQDFDALDCAEADLREVRRIHVWAVEPLTVDDDEEASEAVFAVAAGGDLREGGVVAAEVREVYRRRLLLQEVHDVLRAARRDFCAGDDLHCGGDFIRGLADARGLDNDWRQFCRLSLVRLCGVCAERHGGNRRREQFVHLSSFPLLRGYLRLTGGAAFRL